MATPPRIITPGRSVHLIIRAVNRQYRFRPSPNVVRSIEFIVWHYARVYGVALHEMTWMGNHAHLIVTDEQGVLPAFVGQVNSLISRQLNALRDNKGTNIEKGYTDIEILDDATTLHYCAYTLANPVSAGLVARAGAWKGVSTFGLEYGKSFVVQRPRCGLWSRGPENQGGDKSSKDPSSLPTETIACLHRPKITTELSDADLRARIRLETRLLEQRAEAERIAAGKKILGWRRVLAMKWYESPNTFEPIGQIRKRVAGQNVADEIYHRRRIALFNEAYRCARQSFIEQDDPPIPFPFGTWQMKQSFHRACQSSPDCLTS